MKRTIKGNILNHDGAGNESLLEQDKLFLSLAEQLSQTFLQITRAAEIGKDAATIESWYKIKDISEAAMFLTDAYAMQQRLERSLLQAQIEPVTISSLLYDTAQKLQPLAKRYDVELQLDGLSKLAPVMSDRYILQTALVSLGQVFILAESQNEDSRPLRLMGHRGRYGTVAGFYGEQMDLTASSYRYALKNYRQAKQPLSKIVNGPATGVIIADKLLHSLESKLHVARYHKLLGLAVTLPTCNQLQLV